MAWYHTLINTGIIVATIIIVFGYIGVKAWEKYQKMKKQKEDEQ